MRRVLLTLSLAAALSLTAACGGDPTIQAAEELGLDTTELKNAPRQEAGKVLDRVTPVLLGDAEPTTSETIVTPDAEYTVKQATSDYVESTDGVLAAPKGGTFLVFSVRKDSYPYNPHVGDKEQWHSFQSSTAEVTLDDRAVPIDAADYTISGEYTAVATDGDASNAQFAFTFDGVTQHLGTDGKRVGDPTPGFYEALPVGTADEMVSEIGSETPGEVRSILHLQKVDLTMTAFVPDKKWAPQGKAWAVVTGMLSPVTTPRYRSRIGGGSSLFNTTTTIEKATLDGVPAASKVLSPYHGSENVRLVFEVPVDNEKTTRDLAVTAHVTGPSWGPTELSDTPATVDLTHEFAGKISLMRDSSRNG